MQSASSDALAADLGVVGRVYPVLESDLIETIRQRLLEKEERGELKALNEAMVANAKRYVRRPPPVAGIGVAQKPREWTFDPSVTVLNDLTDADGRVFARAGQVLEPLKYMRFTRVLLFINGDDSDQVEWAKEEAKAAAHYARVILVNGDIQEGYRAFGGPIYFDQLGLLTKRFGIENVPAIVRQVGSEIRVAERPVR